MYAGVGGIIEWSGGDLRGPARTPSPEREFRESDEDRKQGQGIHGGRGASLVQDEKGTSIEFECEDLGKGIVLSDSEEENAGRGLDKGRKIEEKEPAKKRPRAG